MVATGVAANAVPPRFITTGAGVTIDRASVAAGRGLVWVQFRELYGRLFHGLAWEW